MNGPLKDHIQSRLAKADNDLLSAARLVEIEPIFYLSHETKIGKETFIGK